jgi:serine/threonine protein kinase/Flp pilus assembly protein TadD
MTMIEDQARALFLAALERGPDQWPAFLDEACGGHAGVRARVEELLRAHQALGSIHAGRGGGPAATVDLALAERPGTVVGPYKLLEQIGEGGFGVVFLAEQTQPVRRKVALKVLKAGMDTRQVVARFEAERQALALMDHPHIAKVFDGGATASGRPYFVMELVKGVPITDFCDQNHLTPRQRLELFLPVCQAVQHAHQKGIIHRDLKPSNVLVSRHDTTPVVKVIDFGVAKALGQELTDKTLFTGIGQMVGTPLYMSPEQAGLSDLDVDTRSDIYSLGVLLYELLTGTTPFDKERLGKAGYDEIRRIVREEEPAKPSTRISTLGQAADTVSANRQSDPKRLRRLFRGELDWLVMKALEKDRNRRYETASAFAADVLRYLKNEPVLACPPSFWYRFRKLAWRNRRAFLIASAAALVVFLALVGLAVSNVLIRQEQARTKDEKDRTEKAQKLAQDRAAEIQRELEGLQAANALLDRGRLYANSRRWDNANAAFTKAIQRRPDHVSVWVERGDLYARLGLWDLAAADFAQERELREPDATGRWYLHALVRLYIGDADGYRQACRRMRERFRGTLNPQFATDVIRTCILAPGADADLAPVVELAQNATAHYSGSWYALYLLGTAHYRAGQYEPAVRRLRESLGGTPDWAGRAISYPVLAMAHHRLGQTAEARQALEAAAEAIDRWTRDRYQHQEVKDWMHHGGATAYWPIAWWDWLECQLDYREARVLIDGSPPQDDPRLHVLRARAFAGLRWAEKAVPEYDAALKLSPQDPQIRVEAHRNQGYCRVARGQWGEAAAEFAKACELRPEDSYLWRCRAVAHFAAGDVDAYRQACAAMLERFETTEDRATAGNVLLACVLRDGTLPDMARLLPLARIADSMWHWGAWVRGAVLYRAGRYEESVRCFETAAKPYRPRSWDWCFLAMAHHCLGHADEARRCLAEAARWIDEANRHEEDDLTRTRPSWDSWHERVVYALLLREAEAFVGAKEKKN